MQKTITIFLLICLTFPVFAQKNTRIEIKIENIQDSLFYLGSYYGNKSVVVDTAGISDDIIQFDKKDLKGGIYFLVSSKKRKMFELVVDQSRYFSITTDTSAFIEKALIKGSPENELFFDYVSITNRMHDSVRHLQMKLGEGNLTNEESAELRAQLAQINEYVVEYKKDFMEQHPEHVLSLVFRMIRKVDIPDSIRTAGNPALEYRYYKNHYWDEIDLSDERILRTPSFYDKLNTYFTKVIPQHPDSIIREIDQIISKIGDSDELYNYLIWHFIEQYDQEKIMGFDKIFVHLAEQYFRNNDRINTTASVKKQIIERAEKLSPILLGSKAPNLILLDTSNNFRSFFDIDSEFTVLFFWDQDCGVCKDEIKVLKSLTDTSKLELEIFAICTDTNLRAWKSKIKKYEISDWINTNGTRSITQDYHDLYDVYGTPLIFVLNRRKEIIAKKISADQIAPFLYQVKKRNADE